MGEQLQRALVTRYVTPLREGGSLPGIVEADDLGTYVCKFRGAGQGLRVLVAEVIASQLATKLGLNTPRLANLEIDLEIARYEADEEVQDLIRASPGSNLGIDFLPGAFGFDHSSSASPDIASRVMWLDAFIANVDRSWRNPNLLLWHHGLWVIDHGASLYFHHSWNAGVTDPSRFAASAWSSDDHVLKQVARPQRFDEEARELLSGTALSEAVAAVPEEWLEPVPGAADAAALRAAYVEFLSARLHTKSWLPGGGR